MDDSDDSHLVDLPESIALDLSEVGIVLGALDRAADLATGDDLLAIRTATHLITNKVWPELGDLLDDGDN